MCVCVCVRACVRACVSARWVGAVSRHRQPAVASVTDLDLWKQVSDL